MTWFNIQHKPGVARVLIHGEIGVFGIGFAEFERELADAAKVELRINSTGGDSNTALRVAQLLGERDTVATFTGLCCSSAVTLAMTAKRILAHADARLMIHSPVAFAAGSPKELRSEADSLEKLVAPIKELYSRRCSPALVREWLTSGDHWLTPAEAIGCGLVDEVVSPPALDREVEPAATTTSAPDDSPTEAEAFLSDVLNISQGATIRSRARLAQAMNLWLASAKEVL